MKQLSRSAVLAAVALLGGTAFAKLPPLSDEAKAKAEEAKAKTAWSDKVAAYQLCKASDRVAARTLVEQKKAGKPVGEVVATPPCADPGPFVYPPPETAAAPAAPTTAAATPAAPMPVKKP
ncbi:hypothetical protein [Azohydromonas caseinilytica]|uniref:Uncharacterized protein n=1 Tax=Azohydromonas caseinilytica TaxID=2728836 RepID=A0A848F7K3_9BURK|nr:hypothetical protein [Azohydromonas caseinilytica]NML14041.1 hypothetical protein [Azohydromonas caseinilytica]